MRMRAVVWLVLLVSASAGAQVSSDWRPTKAVEIVAGSTAGGALDRTARDVQSALQRQKLVEVPVVVTNKPGAGSSIAWSYVSKQRADANALTVIIPGLLTNKAMGIGSLSHKDLTPIAMLSSEYVVFGVNSSSDLKSGRDLVSVLRADPAKLNIGIATALGGASHIAVAQAMKAAGVGFQRLHFIVYPSSADAVTALLGNHLDLVAASAGNFLPVLRSGRVRTLAITSPQRVAGVFADIPTWTEQGVKSVFAAWRGLAGAPAMTPAQVRFWDETIGRMVQSKDWAELLERTHEQPNYMNSADLASFLDAQSRDLDRTIIELGLAK